MRIASRALGCVRRGTGAAGRAGPGTRRPGDGAAVAGAEYGLGSGRMRVLSAGQASVIAALEAQYLEQRLTVAQELAERLAR